MELICFQVFSKSGLFTNSYFTLGEKKYPILYYPPYVYWLYDNKLFWGTYRSLATWEIELFVNNEIDTTFQLKHYGKLLQTFPQKSILKWGTSYPMPSFYLPEKDYCLLCSIKEEKKGIFTQHGSFYDNNIHIASMAYSLFSRLFRGEIATALVQPDYFDFFPHLLGLIILPNLWR